MFKELKSSKYREYKIVEQIPLLEWEQRHV